MQTYIHACMRTCIRAYMHTCIYVYICTHMCNMFFVRRESICAWALSDPMSLLWAHVCIYRFSTWTLREPMLFRVSTKTALPGGVDVVVVNLAIGACARAACWQAIRVRARLPGLAYIHKLAPKGPSRIYYLGYWSISGPDIGVLRKRGIVIMLSYLHVDV